MKTIILDWFKTLLCSHDYQAHWYGYAAVIVQCSKCGHIKQPRNLK